MSKDKQSNVEITWDHVEIASNNSEFKTGFKFATDARKFQVVVPMRHGEFLGSWISKEYRQRTLENCFHCRKHQWEILTKPIKIFETYYETKFELIIRDFKSYVSRLEK